MQFKQNKRVFRYKVLYNNTLSYQDIAANTLVEAENMMKLLATDRNYTRYDFMQVIPIVPDTKRTTR